VPFTGKVILTPQNVLTARTPQAGEDFPLRTQVLEHEQKVAAWRDARARALADIEKVLEQPNAKQQLQAELAELSVLDPVARQMINREETSSVIGEADPEAIIKSFKDRFGEIKTALKTPPPPPLTLDRFEVRDLNRQFAETYSRVVTPGEDVGGPSEVPTPDGIKVLPPTPDLEAGQLLPTAKVKEIIELRKARKEASELLITPPTVEDHPVLVTDKVTEGLQTANLLRYLNLTFLPSLKYTAPLLLGLLGVWFAWRLVNMPAFGDFLIATEAELNKVSWTTQKRLLQDTVVVLVTVVLLTVFLFFADAGWGMVLKLIGVVQPPTATAKTEKQSW
jgi:preprotein translocase SecE subunit